MFRGCSADVPLMFRCRPAWLGDEKHCVGNRSSKFLGKSVTGSVCVMDSRPWWVAARGLLDTMRRDASRHEASLSLSNPAQNVLAGPLPLSPPLGGGLSSDLWAKYNVAFPRALLLPFVLHRLMSSGILRQRGRALGA